MGIDTEKAAFLAQSDIFCHLPEAEVGELERVTSALVCPPGRILYRPGEAGSMLFLVQAGCVQLYHLSTDGRKLITATLEMGGCFGELPLTGQRVYNSFAETTADTCLYMIHHQDIEQLLARRPEVALALLRVLGQRLAQVETQLVDTTFKSAAARLARLLLDLAQPGGDGIAGTVIEGLSHEALADRLGVYRETVSTALRELKDVGAIEPARKHITIRDAARLREAAEMAGKNWRV